MIRLLIVFAALFLVAIAAAWLADHPGDVVVDWRGYRIESSLAALGLGVVVLMAAAAAAARFWRWLRAGPGALGGARSERRRRRGYKALSEGLVAVAAGDAREAGKLAKRADGLLNDPPLTLLLSAQAAQLGGDEAAAERHFSAMLERPETEFLGLRGLLAQATRAGDRERALGLAKRARELKPNAPWVWRTLFDLETEAGRWADAQHTLEHAQRHKLIEGGEASHRKAVVLYGRAKACQAAGEDEAALAHAEAALKAAPDHVPAAVLVVELLGRAGKSRQAAKQFEKAWARGPHPDLAAAFPAIDPTWDAKERLRRFRKLTSARGGEVETRLALGALAVAAADWTTARDALGPLAAAGDGRAARLMAEVGRGAGEDAAEVQDWLLRAAAAPPPPAWLCGECGRASAAWDVTCPACGAFDSLRWDTPEAVPGVAGALAALSAAVTPAPSPTAEATAPAHPEAAEGTEGAQAEVAAPLEPDEAETAGSEPSEPADEVEAKEAEKEQTKEDEAEREPGPETDLPPRALARREPEPTVIIPPPPDVPAADGPAKDER